MNPIKFETLIQSNRDRILDIAEKHGARNVRIFGSVIHGKAHAGSDVDLLVDLDAICSLLDQIALQQELEELLGIPVDVVEEIALPERIRDQVIKEAVLL